MNKRDVAYVAVKIFGLYCLLQAIYKFSVGLAAVLARPSYRTNLMVADALGGLASSLIPAVVLFALALFLIVRADWIAEMLIPPSYPERVGATLTAFDLKAIAFSVVGLVVLVWAAPELVTLIMFEIRKLQMPMPSKFSGDSTDALRIFSLSTLASTLTKVVLGLVLFLYGERLARFAKSSPPTPTTH